MPFLRDGFLWWLGGDVEKGGWHGRMQHARARANRRFVKGSEAVADGDDQASAGKVHFFGGCIVAVVIGVAALELVEFHGV